MKARYDIHHLKRKGTTQAAAALFGTMVGAGIFALPYAVERSGVGIGLFWLIALAAVALITHLLFGEVVLQTPGKHRLVGYVGLHLGKWQRDVQALASVLGLLGGSLAYLILGGLFLADLTAPIAETPPELWSAILFAFVAYSTWRGANFLARVDLWLSLALAVVLVLIVTKSFWHLEPGNLAHVDYSSAFLPYGLVLFAYGGLSAVTEMKQMISGDKRKAMRRAIIIGTLGAALLTTAFTISTVGALGPATTEESVAGLTERFGGIIPLAGAAAGFLAVITSYVIFSLFLKEQFEFDFGWHRGVSWALTMFVPFAFFAAGIRSFGAVLEVVGSVLGGMSGIFVCWAYLVVRKKYGGKTLRFPVWLVYLLMLAYAAGAVYGLYFRLAA